MTSLAERAALLHAAGVAASDDGRPGLAVRQLRAGLRLAADDQELRGRILVSLAWAESERGRVEAGFRLLDEAEPLLPPAQQGVLFGQRALLLRRSGRDNLALAQYDAAIAVLSEQSRPLDLARALSNRSLVLLDAGRVAAARADLRRSAEIAARHGLALQAAIARLNLGCLDVLASDLPSALRAFSSVQRDYEAMAPGRLVVLAVERARALLAAGLFGEADHELADAMDRAAGQQLTHVYAVALLARAEAALLAGRPQAAAIWARQARAAFRRRDNARRAALAALLELRADQAVAGATPGAGTGGTDGPAGGAREACARQGAGAGMATAARAQAHAARLARLGLPEDARVAGLLATRALVAAGRLTRAERTASRYGPPHRGDRLDTRLLWRLTRAELATAVGRTAEASRHLRAGMAALHRHRSQLGSLDLQTGAAVHGQDLARAGVGAALATGSAAVVYRWSERARAQALLLPPVRPPDDPVAAAALEELRQVWHTLREAELAGRPAGGLRTRAEALRRTIREHSWSAAGPGAGAGPTGPAPLAAVRAELGDAAMVSYLRHGPVLWALVILGRGGASLVQVGRHAEAEEAVLRLRADLDAQAGRAMPARLAGAVCAATQRDAGALAHVVLDPLLPLVGDRDLVVVPTGILATVPWAALPCRARRPVTVTPSATAWLAARRRLGERAAGHGPAPTALLVAGPGNARGAAEVRTIAALYPQPTVLTGPGATPAATLAALVGTAVAHLAAHGHHQAENALFSTLELSGGPLLGYDLQQVGRTPPMVVLSCCDLGLLDIRPGDETFGMATALLSTGSSTVVASVSREADETAMAVMTRYHRLVLCGQSPAGALAAAVPPELSSGFICFGAG